MKKVRNPNGKSNGEFGSRGMTLSDTLYAIHGTNKPSSIGKDESHGCVRMQQADVEELYNMVTHETKVTIGKGVLPPSSNSDGGNGKAAEARDSELGEGSQINPLVFHCRLMTATLVRNINGLINPVEHDKNRLNVLRPLKNSLFFRISKFSKLKDDSCPFFYGLEPSFF